MSQELIDRLNDKLQKLVDDALEPGERTDVRLKGGFDEVLVMTDRRVLIIKRGFMTNNAFGQGIYQLPYRAITMAEVRFALVSGHFELSAGGVQNKEVSYWSADKDSPQEKPNCVSINNRQRAKLFQQAATLIMQRASQPVGTAPARDNLDQLERLAALLERGVLTTEEFAQQKAKLFG